MGEREKCIQAVMEWFIIKQKKNPDYVGAWFNKASALLDGKTPLDLLNNEQYDDVISFARNDLVVMSKKSS